jgi:hypothetical protein
MKTELWKESTTNQEPVTGIPISRLALPETIQAERVAALRRSRIRSMLVQSLCKSLDANERR